MLTKLQKNKKQYGASLKNKKDFVSKYIFENKNYKKGKSIESHICNEISGKEIEETRERNLRTEMIIGKEKLSKLKKSKVLVFGAGGVGGYAIEALGRAGIGTIHIVDPDVVSESNINRQIIALYSTIGKNKAQLMAKRLKDINPHIDTRCYNAFYLPDSESDMLFDFSEYDYVVDAIDTTVSKLDIIRRCKETDTYVISSMGTGNKIHNEIFQIGDISETSICPLAKVMRKKLKAMGIEDVKVVYSIEKPKKSLSAALFDLPNKTPGSISYVPGTAGLLIAGEVIRDLLGE